jgi:prevent-host-death family protein
MREIPAAKFKEQCLALLDKVDPEGIVITKRGKPVAKLIPIETTSASLIGSLRGKLTIKSEITTTDVAWHAQS